MKNVLIATDFSPHSKHAIEFAVKLFQDRGRPCRFLLLNTYLPVETSEDVIEQNDEMKKHSKAGLAADCSFAQKAAEAKLRVETLSRLGTLKHVIKQILHKEKFDLVVMGKDGGKHVEEVSQILQHEGCPLLITYLGPKT